MLTIRSAQMKVLAEAVNLGMADRALRHLQRCLPDICATASESQLRDIIRWGRQRSRSHGIENEVDFFRYLNLMFMFGFEFDVDPRYPWAASTLQATRASGSKMDLLMDHALLFCSRNAEAQSG